jgi:hypothetical protein
VLTLLPLCGKGSYSGELRALLLDIHYSKTCYSDIIHSESVIYITHLFISFDIKVNYASLIFKISYVGS